MRRDTPSPEPDASAAMPTVRQVAAMGLPHMGLMLCYLAISLTDLWVAGRIDASVLAALGVVSQVFTLLMLVTSLAGSGTLAAVSQALGAGRAQRARRYAGLIVVLAICSGSTVGLAGFCSLSLMLDVLGVPADVIPVVRVFVSVYCLNLPFHFTLILLNSVFRGHKLVRLPFNTALLMCAVNLAGSVGLGLGRFGLPAWGYHGIAWSTLLATVLGLACNLLAARRCGILGRGSFAAWRWNRAALPYLARVGVPSALGQLAEHAGRLVMVSFVAALPGAVDIMAGMTLGMRVQSVLLFPLGALSLTMAIFSGHLLGAGQKQVLARFARNAALGSTVLFACLGLGLYSFRETVAAFLSSAPDAVRHAACFLAFSCAGIPAMACAMTLQGVFSGAGATLLMLVAGACGVWGVQVPLGWYLAHGRGWGESGIYTAMVCAEFVSAGIILFFYSTGTWLTYGARTRKPPARRNAWNNSSTVPAGPRPPLASTTVGN